MHQVFDGLEFRVLRDRLFATFEAAPQEAESGFDVDGERAGQPSGLPAGSSSTCGRARTGLHVVGTWGRGTGDARRWPWQREAGTRHTST